LADIETHAESIVERTVTQINNYFNQDISPLIEKVFLKLMGHAMPIPKVNYLFNDQNRYRSEPGLVYAGVKHKVFERDVVGETVAVMGQGSAGLFWTYLLKRAGAAQIIVSDLSDARLSVSTQYGADVCVNAQNDSMQTVVGDLTSGTGVDYLTGQTQS
jgi:hypothetical protein